MPDEANEGGRSRQRRRTRKAIVDAATALLEEGATPSVADIADRADVSRRTVYLYFPTLEQLLLDATVGALSRATVDQALDSADPAEDAEDRVERLVRSLNRMVDETMPLGRTLVRLTVESPADGAAPAPRRGYRRIEWIEQALAPLRDELDERSFERLVSALALVTGWEAFIVLRDVRGLSRDDEEDVTVWAARALVHTARQDRQAH